MRRRHHDEGPLRASSPRSYLRQTRLLAVLALLLLVGGVLSDFLVEGFWNRHSLTAGLVANFIVVVLTLAVVNEAIQRRSRRRWSVLAQYAMFDLAYCARLVWAGLLDLGGLLPPPGESPVSSLDLGGELVRDTPKLTAAVVKMLSEEDPRRRLRETVVAWVHRSQETLGRWAPVMLNADPYAEVIDRHVELASDVSWLAEMLESSDPSVDARHGLRTRFSAAVHLGASVDDDWLAARIVAIAQLAEDLDLGTFKIALAIVPASWWAARLGIETPSDG